MPRSTSTTTGWPIRARNDAQPGPSQRAAGEVAGEVPPVEEGAEDGAAEEEAAQPLEQRRVPELQELQDAGGGQHHDGDARGRPARPHESQDEAPEDNVEGAAEGIVDPGGGRPVIAELGVEAERGDDGDGREDGGGAPGHSTDATVGRGGGGETGVAGRD